MNQNAHVNIVVFSDHIDFNKSQTLQDGKKDPFLSTSKCTLQSAADEMHVRAATDTGCSGTITLQCVNSAGNCT